jgi:hypothetical protein
MLYSSHATSCRAVASTSVARFLPSTSLVLPISIGVGILHRFDPFLRFFELDNASVDLSTTGVDKERLEATEAIRNLLGEDGILECFTVLDLITAESGQLYGRFSPSFPSFTFLLKRSQSQNKAFLGVCGATEQKSRLS